MKPNPLPLVLLVALALTACTTRGPVDRSVDAAHATNTTVGETVEAHGESPQSGIAAALTFPFRLVANVGEALFGP
jgi:hypothetical protein